MIPKMLYDLLEYQRKEWMITENEKLDCIKFIEEKLNENTRSIQKGDILSTGMVDLEGITAREKDCEQDSGKDSLCA